MNLRLFWSCSLLLLSVVSRAQLVSAGWVEHLPDFRSTYIAPRQVDVWLPASYDPTNKRYAVVYMHDGQNLFDPQTAPKGVAWEVDSVLSALAGRRHVQECIVVGIWNTPRRVQEYTPAKPYYALSDRRRAQLMREQNGLPLSDDYLKFIVKELKPYIDRHYRTSPDRAHTFVMGSSLGGLVSLYAALEYPKVFGGAGCLSPHWPLSLRDNTPDFTNAMIGYLGTKLPARPKPRLYFDCGTVTLDRSYGAHQQRIDSVLRAHGYGPAEWTTCTYEGAAHHEAAWRQRVSVPLQFLLGR